MTLFERVCRKFFYKFMPALGSYYDRFLFFKYAAVTLVRKTHPNMKIDELVEEVIPGDLISAIQSKTEFGELLAILKAIKPRLICEIGSAQGGTLFLLSAVAEPDARILSIDLECPPERHQAYAYFARASQKITCLTTDSHDARTLNRVSKWLRGRSLDFLFIDGDHSLDGVTKDYQMYAPLVRVGGLIAFHDIVPDFKTRYGIVTDSYVGQVPLFWSNLKKSEIETQEIVENAEQDGRGIGLVKWQGDFPPSLVGTGA